MNCNDPLNRKPRALPHIHDPFLESWFAVKDKLAAMTKILLPTNVPGNLSGAEDCRGRGPKPASGFSPRPGDRAALQRPAGPTLYQRPEPGVGHPGRVCDYQPRAADPKQRGSGHRRSGRILDPNKYPPETHPFLIEIMRKFEMCFDFPEFVNQKVLIAVKLPLEAPGSGALENPLRFQYRYEVLPESVITRFITRMHAYIDGNIYWRHGVQLKSEDGANQARVQADLEDRRIAIEVAGRPETRRDLLKLVRADFRKIHASFEGLFPIEEDTPQRRSHHRGGLPGSTHRRTTGRTGIPAAALPF